LKLNMRRSEFSVVITAGFAASPAAVALTQMLLRDGVRIAGIMTVTPFQIARAKAVVRSGGYIALKSAVLRALGRSNAKLPIRDRRDPIEALFTSEELNRVTLPRLAKQQGIAFKSLWSLDSSEAISFVRSRNPSGLAYCGGGILRRPFLTAVEGRVLNAHAAPLPQVRGMNAAEWSLLLSLPLEVTIHFIDADVDTGPVVARRPIVLEPGDTIEILRAKAVVEGVRGLRSNIHALAQPIPPKALDCSHYKQVFALSPAMRELAEVRLARRVARGKERNPSALLAGHDS
jgi:hypothetical protein